MGRATRWFKSLFGIKTNNVGRSSEPNNSCYGGGSTNRKLIIKHKLRDPNSGEWICHNPETIPPNITPEEAAWLKSCFPDSPENHRDNEQSNKHAIAVAAATAAAADAAVAAAKAAAEVVRLTSNGRRDNDGVVGLRCGTDGEKLAAVKIQTTFRGYLARKALRALKGLVKIQALVRGYLVRKQANATFQGMQALIRAQAGVRTKRAASQSQPRFLRANSNTVVDPAARHSVDDSVSTSSNPSSSVHHSRRLSASFDHTKSTIINNPSFDDTTPNSDPDPKVVEIDTGRPRPKSSSSSSHHHRRGTYRHTSMSELGEDPSSYQSFLLPSHLDFQHHSRFQPNRLSVPTPHHHTHMRYFHHCCRHHPDPEAAEDEYYYGPSPAHTQMTTPRRFSRYGTAPPPPGIITGPGTGMASPARRRKDMMMDDDRDEVVSLHEAGPWSPGKYFHHHHHQYYGYNNSHPSYMANTQSFKAKARSHSAPRQRSLEPAAAPPGWGGYSYRFSGISHSGGIGNNCHNHNRRSQGLNEMMINGGRSSLSGVKMQRTCSQAQDTVDFKTAVMGRFGSNQL